MFRTPFRPIRLLGCVSLVVAGCGGADATAEPPAQPQITSAPVSTQPDTAAQLAQVTNERDQAQEAAKTMQAQLATERDQNDRRMQVAKTHDDFEDMTWTRLDRIDTRTDALKSDLTKASAARRTKVDKMLKDIASKRDSVEKNARHVRSIPPASWDTFTRDVDTALITIEQDLDHAEATR